MKTSLFEVRFSANFEENKNQKLTVAFTLTDTRHDHQNEKESAQLRAYTHSTIV